MINNLLAIGSGAKAAPPPSVFYINSTSAPEGYNTVGWGIPTFYGAFSKYEVYRDSALKATITNVNTNGWTDGSVGSGVTYSYFIRAWDTNGAFRDSQTVSITSATQEGPTINSWNVTQDATNLYCTVSASDYGAGLSDCMFWGYKSGGKSWNAGDVYISPAGQTHYTWNFTFAKSGLTLGVNILFCAVWDVPQYSTYAFVSYSFNVT